MSEHADEARNARSPEPRGTSKDRGRGGVPAEDDVMSVLEEGGSDAEVRARWLAAGHAADDPLTAELEERVVEPTRAAGQLFRDHPYMTRLFTTLSPHEMNRDPVFSYNDNQLPDLARRHEAASAQRWLVRRLDDVDAVVRSNRGSLGRSFHPGGDHRFERALRFTR